MGTLDGLRTMRFAYLIGADGIRSDVRDLVGVRWVGYTHWARFLITDIRGALDLPHERHFHYDPPANPGSQLVMHAQPDGVWRIDWQLSPEVSIAEEKANGRPLTAEYARL